jgi:hypothetical protein
MAFEKSSVLSFDPRLRLFFLNPLNAELNSICHLLALLGAHHILHFSEIGVIVPSVGKLSHTVDLVSL